jgi:hypothetical protein
MAGLTQFLADMTGSKADQQQAQQRFAKDPEAVMTKYGLSDAHKAALRKSDFNALGKHVATEMKSALDQESVRANW